MSVIGGLVIYGYLGMYPTFLREGLRYSPAAAGSVMSLYGLGALVSIGGGWLGDRFSPRIVLTAAFFTSAVSAICCSILRRNAAADDSFIQLGRRCQRIIYVNLGGYLVKSLGSSLASRGTGIFVTSPLWIRISRRYVMGWIATYAGWATAGAIQFSLLCLIAGSLALALRPDRCRR